MRHFHESIQTPKHILGLIPLLTFKHSCHFELLKEMYLFSKYVYKNVQNVTNGNVLRKIGIILLIVNKCSRAALYFQLSIKL